MLYARVKNAAQEVADDHPAMMEGQMMTLAAVPEGQNCSLWWEGAWAPATRLGSPSRHDFIVSVVSFEDEPTVGRALQENLRKMDKAVAPWVKVISPSKQGLAPTVLR